MNALETTVVVTVPHARSYEAPITLERGARVAVLRRDTTWPEWLWCRDAGGREGWVHQSVLSIEGERATAQRHYDAIELTAEVGERLRCSERLGGWAWCTHEQGQAGWIPEANLIPMEKE